MATEIYRGDTVKFEGAVTYKAGGAFNLTSCTIYLSAKVPGASTVLFSVACSIVSGVGGTYEVELTAAQAGTTCDNAILELEITTAGGRVLTARQKRLTILDDAKK